MKVRVIEERCQGHTMCFMACPEVFQLRDEDGHAFVPQETVAEEFQAKVRAAADSCPEDAIEVFES